MVVRVIQSRKNSISMCSVILDPEGSLIDVYRVVVCLLLLTLFYQNEEFCFKK